MKEDKEAEKKHSDEELKAKTDKITKIMEVKETLAVKVKSLEDRLDNLEEQISTGLTLASPRPNAQSPVNPAQVTPGSANPDVIH